MTSDLKKESQFLNRYKSSLSVALITATCKLVSRVCMSTRKLETWHYCFDYLLSAFCQQVELEEG